MSRVMYGHDVSNEDAAALFDEAQSHGWKRLMWTKVGDGVMWRLFGVPPDKSEPISMDEQQITAIELGQDVDSARLLEAQDRALANGFTRLRWVYNDAYTHRVLLGVRSKPKSEPRPTWLDEGEAIAFTMPADDSYAHDRIQLRSNAIDMAVAHGWTRLRWVDDRDQGLFHLVGKRLADDRGRLALPIGDPMLKAVQREQDMDDLRKREAKQPLDAPKSTDLARAELVDAFNEWARKAHCTRQEWDVIREDIRAALWGRVPKDAPPEPEIEPAKAPSDGSPNIRSELGGLMGPGYQATGYEPPPRRRVLLDDPTGDDIAGDVK